jgi:hypothetical protein
MRRIDEWLLRHDCGLTRVAWLVLIVAIAYLGASVALR